MKPEDIKTIGVVGGGVMGGGIAQAIVSGLPSGERHRKSLRRASLVKKTSTL